MKNKNQMDSFFLSRQSLEEMKEVYENQLCRHFPADERKPFHYIKKWYEEGKYRGIGLYQKDAAGNPTGKCLAYAWICFMKEEGWALLDYYAVEETLRGKGIGSWFLQQVLRTENGGMPVIIEVENPDELGAEIDGWDEEAKAQERWKRLRRIAFYQKNGVRETKLSATVFHVPYRIMVSAEEQEIDVANLKDAYYAFYAHIPDQVAFS